MAVREFKPEENDTKNDAENDTKNDIEAIDYQKAAPSVKEAPTSGQAVRDRFGFDEIFKRVLATADHELSRPLALLFWSGFAGGGTLGFCLLAKATMDATTGSEMMGNLVYPIGFIFLIIGRYQLFTENTLTPVTLVFTRLASLRDLGRIWGVVFLANLLGAGAIALLFATTPLLDAQATEAARGYATHLLEASWSAAFVRAVLAGWILAGLVWLVHAVPDSISRLLLIWFLMFVQVFAAPFHCIVGSVEMLYLVFSGGAHFGEYLGFLLPVTLGNTVGGVVVVALLNYAQFGADKEGSPFAERGERLSWDDWFFAKTHRTSAEPFGGLGEGD